MFFNIYHNPQFLHNIIEFIIFLRTVLFLLCTDKDLEEEEKSDK